MITTVPYGLKNPKFRMFGPLQYIAEGRNYHLSNNVRFIRKLNYTFKLMLSLRDFVVVVVVRT